MTSAPFAPPPKSRYFHSAQEGQASGPPQPASFSPSPSLARYGPPRMRQARQALGGVDEREVHAPGVDADRDRLAPERAGAADALQDVAVEGDHVPVEAAGQGGLGVPEAVRLLEAEPGAVEAARDDASAACAQVGGDVDFLVHGGRF